jgi:capsular polysaccharide export protein
MISLPPDIPQCRHTAVALSRGILRIPHLSAFLPECERIVPRWRLRPDKIDVVVGWGYKETARRARALAARQGLPYLALEDGFLRSLRLGRDGEPPLSMVCDPVGIYYDAHAPSQLENLLQEGGWESSDLLARAAFARRWLVDERLSKYNHAPDRDPWEGTERERVLVLDQTWNDASMTGGMADERTFARMLQAAIDENPHAEVVVKTHPDVLAGHRRGYLSEIPKHPRLRLLAEDLHPWALLDGVETVYTVTSLMGAEALLAGKRVRCFGLPFYAGWGLTEDEIVCPRRGRQRSLDELFAAAWMLYARYVDPMTGERCGIERIIALLADRRRHRLRVAQPTVCSGMSLWKRRFLPDFIATEPKRAHFVRRPETALRLAAEQGHRWTLWASRETEELREEAGALGVPIIRVEDAFLRSVGLGSDLVRPWSLVLDDQGIYYDGSRPSRMESLLRDTRFSQGLLHRARQLRQRIVTAGISKYNVGALGTLSFDSDGRTMVLVPGQVEDDASILRGSPQVQSNLELLRRVRAARPEAFVIFKPHPDVVAGNRRGAVAEGDALHLCDAVMTEVAIGPLLEQVDEVHTLTSLAGFEGLLRGKKVVTYGLPFYAGWGLTDDHLSSPRRNRRLCLDELIAGALILYPVYIDPGSRQVCSAEHLLDWLAGNRRAGEKPSLAARLIRQLKRLSSKFSSSP